MADFDASLRIAVSSDEAVRNARRVRDAIKDIGREARRTQRNVDTATDEASGALSRTAAAARDTRSSFQELANSSARARDRVSSFASKGADRANRSLAAASTSAGVFAQNVDGVNSSLATLSNTAPDAAKSARSVSTTFNRVGTAAAKAQARVEEGSATINNSLASTSAQAAETTDNISTLGNESRRTRDALNGLAKQGAEEAADKTDRANSKAKALSDTFTELRRQVVSLNGVLLRVGATVATLGAPAVGAGGLAAISVVSTNAADNLQDVADRSGVAVERLQRLRFVAGQLGVESEKLNGALQGLQSTIDAVARGEAAGGTANALRRIGIDPDRIQQFEGRIGDLFRRIIQGTRELDASAQSNVLENIFNATTAEQLLSFTRVGQRRINELEQAASQLGLVVEKEAIQKAERANRVFLAFWQTLKGKVVQAVAENADEIERLAAEALQRLPSIIDRIVEASKSFIRNLETITRIAGTIGGALIGSIFGPLGRLLGVITGSQLPEAIQGFTRLSGTTEQYSQAVNKVTEGSVQLDDSLKQVNQSAQEVRSTFGGLFGLLQENSGVITATFGALTAGSAGSSAFKLASPLLRVLGVASKTLPVLGTLTTVISAVAGAVALFRNNSDEATRATKEYRAQLEKLQQPLETDRERTLAQAEANLQEARSRRAQIRARIEEREELARSQQQDLQKGDLAFVLGGRRGDQFADTIEGTANKLRKARAELGRFNQGLPPAAQEYLNLVNSINAGERTLANSRDRLAELSARVDTLREKTVESAEANRQGIETTSQLEERFQELRDQLEPIEGRITQFAGEFDILKAALKEGIIDDLERFNELLRDLGQQRELDPISVPRRTPRDPDSLLPQQPRRVPEAEPRELRVNIAEAVERGVSEGLFNAIRNGENLFDTLGETVADNIARQVSDGLSKAVTDLAKGNAVDLFGQKLQGGLAEQVSQGAQIAGAALGGRELAQGLTPGESREGSGAASAIGGGVGAAAAAAAPVPIPPQLGAAAGSFLTEGLLGSVEEEVKDKGLELTATLNEVSGNAFKEIETTSSRLFGLISNTSTEISRSNLEAETAGQLSGALAKTRQGINAILDEYGGAAQSLSNIEVSARIGEDENPGQFFRRLVNEATDQFSRIPDELQTLIDGIDFSNLEQGLQQAQRLADIQSGSLFEQQSQTQRRFERLQQRADRAKQLVEQAGGQRVAELRNQFDSTVEQQTAQLGLRRAGVTTADDLQKLAEQDRDVTRTFKTEGGERKTRVIATAEQIQKAADRVAELRGKMEEASSATDDLTKSIDKQLSQAQDQVVEEFERGLLKTTDPLKARIEAEKERFEQQLETAKKINADIELVEKAHQERLLEIRKEAQSQEISQLRQLAEQAGNLAALPGELRRGPEARLTDRKRFEAQQQNFFQNLLPSARGGDLEAARQLERAAPRLLDQASEVFATGPRFEQIRSRIFESLRGFEDVQTQSQREIADLTRQDINEIGEKQITLQEQNNTTLQDILEALRNQDPNLSRQKELLEEIRDRLEDEEDANA